MKLIGLFMMLSLTFNAQASNIYLFCKPGETPNSCRTKVEKALSKLECRLNSSETSCQYALLPDPNHPEDTDARVESNTAYCTLSSSNCSDPEIGNFGGENCDEKESVTIPRSDGVHHNYWFGPFGSYSRTLCRAR